MDKRKNVLGLRIAVCFFMILSCMLMPKAMVFAGTNNSQSSAESIHVNQTYTGFMDSDYSWYQTTLAQDGYFYVDFNRLSEDGDHYINSGWSLSLYVNGKFILEDKWISEADSAYTTPLYGYQKGTKVYVRITDKGAAENVGYKFTVCNKASDKWESEKNNSLKTADKLAINKYYYGNFDKSDSVDYYYAKLTKTGYAQVYLGRRDLDGDKYINSGWKVSVFVDNKLVMEDVFVSESSALDGYVSPKFGYKKGQKIYVRVANSGADDSVDYKLKIKNTSSGSWETETNNKKSKADTLKNNKKIYGACTRSNDTDWYKYKVTKTGKLKVYAGKSSIDDTGWYSVEVYVNGKRVLASTIQNKTMEKLDSIQVKKGQTVYIKVTSNYQSTYAIKVKK